MGGSGDKLTGMNQVIAWAGFAGAWRPDPPSPWWWLLPPVMYLIRHHRASVFRQTALAQLTQAQRNQFTSFVNKASGWFTVALGAALLAVEETWQITDRDHWPGWLFWLLIIVMLGASVVNTALRMMRDGQPAHA